MPPDVGQQVAIARLETQVEHLLAALAELREANAAALAEIKTTAKLERDEARQALATLQTQVGAMQTTLSEARGGWKTLLAAVGLAGAIGSALTYAIAHFKG